MPPFERFEERDWEEESDWEEERSWEFERFEERDWEEERYWEEERSWEFERFEERYWEEEEEEREELEEWVELSARFFEDRVLFLFQELDKEMATNLSACINYLNMEDQSTRIQLMINSKGGKAKAALDVYDTMAESEAPVETFCLGRAGSVTSLLLASGKAGYRVGFPHCLISLNLPDILEPEPETEEELYHRLNVSPPTILDKTKEEKKYHIRKVVGFSNEMSRVREKLTSLYAKRTGQPFSVIYEDMERKTVMTAEEAYEYGLIDRIGLKVKERAKGSSEEN